MLLALYRYKNAERIQNIINKTSLSYHGVLYSIARMKQNFAICKSSYQDCCDIAGGKRDCLRIVDWDLKLTILFRRYFVLSF
jgi:hypothetical protein